MLTNYHSHTHFCDGRATMEEFVVAAIERGFSDWGFSPHCPMPMLKHAPWAMSMAKVESYIDEARRLKQKYADRIRLHIGMEIDYVDAEFNPASDYFQSLPLDYRIGSVHLLKSPRTGKLLDMDCSVDKFAATIRSHFSGSLQRAIEAYYRAQSELVEVGGFDFIAHSDKISSNARALSSKVMDRVWYGDLVDNFLSLCAEKGVVLEINTKAYSRKGIFFPDVRYFSDIERKGIVTIINSDVHRIEYMASGLSEARELFGGEVKTL